MDPASVSSLASTAVRLLYDLSNYVDETLQASKEVQKLSNEISGLHVSIGQIKAVLDEPVALSYKQEWNTIFEPLLAHCHTSFKEIGATVTKSKITNKISSPTQLIYRISWKFDDQEIKNLRESLVSHKINLTLIYQILLR